MTTTVYGVERTVVTMVSGALYELSELRATKLRYPAKAPARLKALAKRYEVAPGPAPAQRKILEFGQVEKLQRTDTTTSPSTDEPFTLK